MENQNILLYSPLYILEQKINVYRKVCKKILNKSNINNTLIIKKEYETENDASFLFKYELRMVAQKFCYGSLKK